MWICYTYSDVNKTIVLSKGIPNGENAWIPLGGQIPPMTSDGAKLYVKMPKKIKKKHNFWNNK
jgi:hypothetical protein